MNERHGRAAPAPSDLEFWRAGGPLDTTSAEAAKQVEDDGWDGQMFMDSQSLSGDPYVAMGAWALATERLKLSTGVTNPLTRHPAVTAASAAMVQSISGGRAVLGIGRGDSAPAYLGYAPVSLAAFDRTLRDLQDLLGGRDIAFDAHVPDAASAESLALRHRPASARLEWLPPDLPKVPLDVAATGPKVIAMAAAIAERVTFSVGAMPERLRWALENARRARAQQGLTDEGIRYGAQVIVVCDHDAAAARAVAARVVVPLARFQVVQGAPVGPLQGDDEHNFSMIRANYDMTHHGATQSDAKLSGAVLTDDFVERFAIVGPPSHCVERLVELVELGITRFMIVGSQYPFGTDTRPSTSFVREVMPAVRRACSGK